MTRKEAEIFLYKIAGGLGSTEDEEYTCQDGEKMREAIKVISQQPCSDIAEFKKDALCAISRIGLHYCSIDEGRIAYKCLKAVEALSPVTLQPKIGRCKDCRWWKDSDGVYRRDCFTESQCPINRKEVYEGNGYCYMFEPQEREVKK